MTTATPRRAPTRRTGRTVLIGASSTVLTIAAFVVLWLMLPDTAGRAMANALAVWGILAVGALATALIGTTASTRWRPLVVGAASGFVLGTILLCGLAVWILTTADFSG